MLLNVLYYKRMTVRRDQSFDLTHISSASFLWDIGKHNSPRCDAAKRGVPSGAILFALLNSSENEIKMKNYSRNPLKRKWAHPIDPFVTSGLNKGVGALSSGLNLLLINLVNLRKTIVADKDVVYNPINVLCQQ